jgi:hypothetical protein
MMEVYQLPSRLPPCRQERDLLLSATECLAYDPDEEA